MALALLAVAALAWWLHQRGELQPAIKRWGAVAALGLLAVLMLKDGKLAFAAVAGVAALFWYYGARTGIGEAGAAKRAQALLGVDASADADAIHAAWRRRAGATHPDAGGDAVSMQAATDARDLLLSRLHRR